MTSLDVTGCISLEDLQCDDNLLTNLNVSNCTALQKLICTQNQLTSLDVTGCSALELIWCYNNSLTSLDVSDCIVLENLNCSQNQLSSLDVNGCVHLTFINCKSNQLTGLNASGCIALSSLDCSQNQLDSLDVSECTVLKKLICNSNLLTNLDVSNNSNITNLDFSYMPDLSKVCVWEMPFPPSGTKIDTTNSPNVYFTTDCAATALEPDKVTSKLNIHPNPAKEYIIFDVANISSSATVELYDLQGKKVLEQELSLDKRVTISSFPKGIYLYRLHDKGTVYSGKITVE